MEPVQAVFEEPDFYRAAERDLERTTDFLHRYISPPPPIYHRAPPLVGDNVYQTIGQQRRQDTFYIPNPRQAQMTEFNHHQRQNLFHHRLPFRDLPPRRQLNSAQPAEETQQSVPAATHHRRPECTQGFRRANDGSLTCSVCVETLTRYIWRCTGCVSNS